MSEAMFIRYDWMGAGLIDWNIERMCGYKPVTTYYTDFSIADRFGMDGVKDTYARCREQAIEMGYVWLTELVMVLNWKIWEHNGVHKDDAMTDLYLTLWHELQDYAAENLKDGELDYYYRTVD